MKIMIAGGGIGGLVAAIALVQRGFDVRVVEQASGLREVGAGVQISPNGSRVLAALGLLEPARAVAVEPEGKEIRLWNSGETWPLFDLGGAAEREFGFPYFMLHRADLQAVLATAFTQAAPGALALRRRLVSVEQDAGSVCVLFEDGSRETADLLIGADGVHSAVRAAVAAPAPARFTGCMAWRGVVPTDRLPERFRRPVGVNWVGPGRHVVTYPLRRGELVNFVGVVERSDWTVESWTERGSREECARDFEGWHPDVQSLIDGIDDHYRWALLSRPPTETWCRGRVALLGDACHPMLPFMAQGAVMAMEDGIVLARAIAGDPAAPGRAFAAYEAARVARANRCVVAAERNRAAFHDDRLGDAAAAGRYVAANWNEAAVRARYDWLFAHDAVGLPLAAASEGRAQREPA